MDLFFPTDSFWQLAFPQRRFPEHRIRAVQTRAHPHRSFAGSFPCSPSLPPSLWVAQCTLSTMVFPNTRTSLHQASAVLFVSTHQKGPSRRMNVRRPRIERYPRYRIAEFTDTQPNSFDILLRRNGYAITTPNTLASFLKGLLDDWTPNKPSSVSQSSSSISAAIRNSNFARDAPV